MPLYRQEKEFERYGVNITHVEIARWTILCAERYLSVFYDYLHQKLYDYQTTRKAEHSKDFLKEFKEVCVTDGYEVYHKLEKGLLHILP